MPSLLMRPRAQSEKPGAKAERATANQATALSAILDSRYMGDPSEIEGLALLLASDASSFMTGGVCPIDGGALLQGPSLPAID
jgi:NAD(P)-dependent dehydrogenase (short-subunit alcohol dehydrogenase family)